MNEELEFRLQQSREWEIIHAVLQLDGAIFGGYLRDVIANQAPNDLDVAILNTHHTSLKATLSDIGFVCTNQEPGYEEWESKNRLFSVDVVLCEDELKDCLLGPCCYPDYDVNLLTLDKNGLREWTGYAESQGGWIVYDICLLIDISPSSIVQRILQRKAIALKPSEERKAKFARNKYFRLLPIEEIVDSPWDLSPGRLVLDMSRVSSMNDNALKSNDVIEPSTKKCKTE